jgi:hypothetical protein
VGSAGNAPVRHFRSYFTTLDLQSNDRNASRGVRLRVVKNGSGGGNHTHLKEFMRLLSVL